MRNDPMTPRFAETLARIAALLPDIPEQCYDKLEGIAIGMRLRPDRLRQNTGQEQPDAEQAN